MDNNVFLAKKQRRRIELERFKNRLVESGFSCQDGVDHFFRDNPVALTQAIPLLTEILQDVDAHPFARDMALHSLRSSSVSAKIYLDELKNIKLYLSGEDSQLSSLGWKLADALESHATPDMAEEILAIICDKNYGHARRLLPLALPRFKQYRKQSIKTLLENLDDEDVAPTALTALSKMKAIEATPAIQRALDSPDSSALVKKEARKALKKLEKAAATTTPKVSTKKEQEQIPETPPAEASMNFDAEDLPPFLTRISKSLKGFGKKQMSQIEDHLLTAEIDDESTFDFKVEYQGKKAPLQITIFMDDVDAPDVAFFSVPEVTQMIDRELEKIME